VNYVKVTMVKLGYELFPLITHLHMESISDISKFVSIISLQNVALLLHINHTECLRELYHMQLPC
jgi:hypothetical protein